MLSALVAAAMMHSPARYTGPPELNLTAAVVEAGGGAAHFSSRKLFFHLAGPHSIRESAKLTRQYGVHQIAQFFAVFDTYVDSAMTTLQSRGQSLPQVPVPRGDQLSNQLYGAGVLPDGRYDVGYMLEHLLSRPMHVQLMHQVEADPHIGPATNAQFHVILTTAVRDLHQFYGAQ